MIRVGQYRLANGRGPYGLAVHFVRSDGKPGCGRVVTEYDGDPMVFVTWNDEPAKIDCGSAGCKSHRTN